MCSAWINWDAVVAIATLAAAVAAAFAAIMSGRTVRLAKQQLEEDIRWRKLDRAYSHSPYRSESFQQAIRKIDDWFPGWEEAKISYTYEKINESIDRDTSLKREFRKVLNHWGRMASEVERGIVDQDVVEEIAKLNFTRFFKAFENYIRDGRNKSYYKNMISLNEKWKVKN